jgi:hypothetical protein
MRRSKSSSTAVAVLVVAAAVSLVQLTHVAGATSASSAYAAATVIDRTVSCRTGAALGARTVDVHAVSGFRKAGRFEWLGQLVVSTPGQPVPRRPGYMPTLVGLTAGWPPSPPFTSGSLGINTARCTPTSARVTFTKRGLAGGRASRLLSGDEAKCYAPETVLIRVRASFFGTAILVRSDDRTMLQAIARIRKGQVAVRTPKGKALLYGEVDDAGTTRLFSARSCI